MIFAWRDFSNSGKTKSRITNRVFQVACSVSDCVKLLGVQSSRWIGVSRSARHEFPGLVRRETEDRAQHPAEAREHLVKGRLRRTPARRLRSVGVKPVLDDIVINAGQLDGRELADPLINRMEFISFVSRGNVVLELAKGVKNPAVQSGQ